MEQAIMCHLDDYYLSDLEFTENNPDFLAASKAGELFYQEMCCPKFPINPFEIIASHPNWSILIEDLYDEDGFIMKKGNKFRIVVNKYSYHSRSNFTTIHEIAHIKLNHFDKLENCHNFSRINTLLDKEANAFAGAFLMPKSHFSERLKIAQMHYCSETSIIKYLCNYFGTSKQAVETRAIFCGLHI